MREEFAPRDRHVLVKSPNYRHQALRRRIAAVCGVLVIALVSSIIGVLSHRHEAPLGEPQTRPFSYLSE